MAMEIRRNEQFTNDQMAIIRTTVAKGTTEPEFRLFLEVCKYHQLNPFARQIYAVVREGYSGRQLSIQTSIDGYRLLAERSGKYAGQVGPEWCGEDGVWKDVWLGDNPPSAARVGVLRKDFSTPIWAVAKFKSYVQTKKDGSPSTMWAKMPDVMLAKCAESLALRKAFPAEMSGIYTKEEMDQADNDLPTVDISSSKVVESVQEMEQVPTSKALYNLGKEAGMWRIAEEFYQEVATLLNITCTKDTTLTLEQRRLLASIIEAGKDYASSKQEEPAPQVEQRPQLAVVPAPEEPAITAKQIDHIRKLSKYLNKPEPDQITALTGNEASQIIQKLTVEYKAVRAAK